jgi:ribonucleoside-diphosphate reductase alpha chain
MLDNVVDLLDFNVDRVREATTGNRRIGLGLMSVADAFYKMGVQYGSDEAVRYAGQIMLSVQRAAEAQSEKAGRERGVFPNFELSEFHQLNDEGANIVRRNAALTSIAPTGTISRSFDVSGGMEPEFMLFTTHREILNGTILHTVNRHFLAACKRHGIEGSHHPIIRYAMKHGRIADAPKSLGVPEEIRRVFVVTADISAKDHARMQAAFQQWCDNSISKTINFPHEATEEEVAEGYYHSWQLGCKGCTVYRDGSRVFQVLNSLDEDEVDAEELVSSNMASSSSSTDELPALITENIGKDCPDCDDGGKIRRSESCSECVMCGWSACDTPPRFSSPSPPTSPVIKIPSRGKSSLRQSSAGLLVSAEN